METEPQQVYLAARNQSACPVGFVLVLDPATGSDDSLRPGACTACAVGRYNVNPLTGLCLACPPSATCINGAPPLFGAERVTGTVEMELPDDGDDALQQALAVKLGVETWQLTVLPQQRRSTVEMGRFTCPSYGSDRHARATLELGRHYTYPSRTDASVTSPSTTVATTQRRRTATVSFELVADAERMAELSTSLAALGVELGEPEPMGPQAAAGEVWEEIDSSFLLRSCPPGHQLLNASDDGSFDVDAQRCRPCAPNTYIVDQMFPCKKCPKGAMCPDGVAFVSNAAGSEWEVEPAADGGLQKRILSCPAGASEREQESMV